MRKLLLENVSSVSEGSQVTLTRLTAQELDKIRIIRKKSSFSLVYSQYKNALESAKQTGSHLLLSRWKQQQLCGDPDSALVSFLLSWRTRRALLAGSGLNSGTSGSKIF